MALKGGPSALCLPCVGPIQPVHEQNRLNGNRESAYIGPMLQLYSLFHLKNKKLSKENIEIVT